MSRPSDFYDGSMPASQNTAYKVESPELGVRGYLRWFWRQLTSMRVALILLLLLAVAAIPGSLLPQRSADPNGVIAYQTNDPKAFAILDAFPIQAFDVYGSVWFSAIYLLLFISLIGCVLPRIAHHWKALRGAPPKTPARLQRMAGFAETRISNPESTPTEREAFATQAIDAAAKILRRQRYRVQTQRTERRGIAEVSVSAERGYLRETGNLLFHVGLVGVLVFVGVGGALTFHGQRVIVEGESMVNAIIDFDTVNPGRSFDEASLIPFSLRLDDLDVVYVTPDDGNLDALGQVRDFTASVTLIKPDGTESSEQVKVNHPLRVYGSQVYLLGNGYAPKLTVRDSAGEVVFQEAVPFIPQDTNLTSLGVVKVPDGLGTQLGLRGFFYPTKADLDSGAFTSNYPDLENPVLTIDAFVGNLGIDEGIPQSVYALDTSQMEQLTGRGTDVKSLQLTPGETVQLPNGLGSITLESVPRYVSFDVMRNPAQVWILVFALIATFGLLTSLFVPRRRMWVKAVPSEDGVVLEYAALARGDDPTLARAVAQLRDEHRDKL
ncbi:MULTISPECIES: cytochrome c biogenesis protein ResB [unclassified Leucobacter]|uniref:cytochrome c biogenesis protein ResB n=1 Tax=unclassified Leucobacter TaxID=2621730 RepID=UPI00165D3876|nr:MULTISPECIES: cytochrome c biogenesis protein ResB [unclassified Leucobacter]MBC9936505.1 cytochrome c biogenesis protein ResB [Leucobacter sp. cx-87]